MSLPANLLPGDRELDSLALLGEILSCQLTVDMAQCRLAELGFDSLQLFSAMLEFEEKLGRELDDPGIEQFLSAETAAELAMTIREIISQVNT